MSTFKDDLYGIVDTIKRVVESPPLPAQAPGAKEKGKSDRCRGRG